jgi:hypothetical protein
VALTQQQEVALAVIFDIAEQISNHYVLDDEFDCQTNEYWLQTVIDSLPENHELTQLYDKLEAELSDYFIDNEGRTRRTAQVEQYAKSLPDTPKARIVCGEQDSFGWLTGVFIYKTWRCVYG